MIASVDQKLKNSIQNNYAKCGCLKTGTALFTRHLTTPPVTPLEPMGCWDWQDTEKAIKIDAEPNQHRIPVHVVSLSGPQPLLIWKHSNGKKNVLKRCFFYTTRHLSCLLVSSFCKANLLNPVCIHREVRVDLKELTEDAGIHSGDR